MTSPQATSSRDTHRLVQGELSQSPVGCDAPRQWRLAVLVSEALCPGGDWWRLVQSIVGSQPSTRGVDCIQLREKALDDRQLLERAKRLVALCRPHRVGVVINDRPDITVAAGADGVHLGQSDMPCAQARKNFGNELVIGVSTSCLDHAKRALDDGADYCGVGPMFPTTTKQKDVIVGTAYLRQYVAWGKLPHLAIGGISADNVGLLRQAGAQAVAVSRAVCAAADPQQAAGQLTAALTD